MKNAYSIFTIVITFLTLISCGDDDDKKNEERLIGSWVAVQTEVTECNDPNQNFTQNLSCTEEACTTLILNEDGNYQYTVKENLVGITESGIWSLSGNTITFTFSDEDVETTYQRNFTISDDVLILTNTVESTGCIEATTYNTNDQSTGE